MGLVRGRLEADEADERLDPGNLDGPEAEAALGEARHDALPHHRIRFRAGERRGIVLHDALVGVQRRERLEVVLAPAAQHHPLSAQHRRGPRIEPRRSGRIVHNARGYGLYWW